jgi:spermidine/putrescine transport system permease protein
VIDRLLRWAGRAYIALAFGFVFAPIVTLVLFAFNENRFPSLPWTGFSLAWFEAIANDPEVLSAARRSAGVALSVAVLATLLGATAAYCVTRWEFRGKAAYLGIVVAPPCIPLLILGLALLIFMRQLHLANSLLAVVIGHTVIAAPFAFGIVRMRLAELDPQLEQAAWNLGATEWSAIREVVLPQAYPSLIAAFLLAMTVSWDEFIVAWFLSGMQVTLPVYIWTSFQAKISTAVNAIGTIAFAVSISFIALAEFIFFRGERRDIGSPRI